MISRADLKQIVMLTYLSDDMLDTFAGIIDLLQFDRDEVIFREGDPSERFYMLKSGQVLLEQRISDHVTACLAAIKPGYSFGWSAMMENERYTVSALCNAPSEVFSFTSVKAHRLFRQYPEIGMRLHKRLLVIIKKRLEIRTEQFRQAITHHPDMQVLFTSPSE
ncbi:MAG: cyclic nucleotide-binding domain-containing protein [Desulfosarcinaceae bacterium]|nr:cyclic nucleotide-binding domain-containing protein [Desulfosarcinaceae bacterium]